MKIRDCERNLLVNENEHAASRPDEKLEKNGERFHMDSAFIYFSVLEYT